MGADAGRRGVRTVTRVRNHYLWLALAASLAAAALTHGYLRRHAATVPVVVAAVDLTRSQRLMPHQLRVVPMPAPAVHPLALGDPERAVGRVLRWPLPAGAPLLEPYLAGDGAMGVWAAQLEAGEGAIFVPAGPERALGGALEPGDVVDLLFVGDGHGDGDGGPAAVLLMRGARVLDLRDPDGRPAAGDAYPAGALLAVPAVELTRVALALERGRVILALAAPSAPVPPPAVPEDLWMGRPEEGAP